MGAKGIFGGKHVRRALAVLACAALVYFAAGGVVLHHHSASQGEACHICQALHMPVLAAATFDPVAVPEFVTWYSALGQHSVPLDSFDLHRASRAPPAA